MIGFAMKILFLIFLFLSALAIADDLAPIVPRGRQSSEDLNAIYRSCVIVEGKHLQELQEGIFKTLEGEVIRGFRTKIRCFRCMYSDLSFVFDANLVALVGEGRPIDLTAIAIGYEDQRKYKKSSIYVLRYNAELRSYVLRERDQFDTKEEVLAAIQKRIEKQRALHKLWELRTKNEDN